MAGFFESMHRLIKGEPVFNAGDQADAAQQGGGQWTNANGETVDHEEAREQGLAAPEQPAEPRSTVQKGNPNTFPVVYVHHTKPHMNGNNMNIYCSIVNKSNGPVEVEEVHIAGRSRRMGGYLRAGEEREWLCYSGPRLKNESYHEAQLNYKDETGDYFQSIHDVEYQYLDHDKTYAIEELRLRLPIRDIYG